MSAFGGKADIVRRRWFASSISSHLGTSFVPLTWRFVQNWLSLNPPALDPTGCFISATDKKTPASEGSGLFSRQLPCEGSALSSAKLISADRDLFFGKSECLLLGVKRTCRFALQMSAYDSRLNRSTQHKR